MTSCVIVTALLSAGFCQFLFRFFYEENVVNFIREQCLVVRSVTGGRSFMELVESMIRGSSIKWRS